MVPATPASPAVLHGAVMLLCIPGRQRRFRSAPPLLEIRNPNHLIAMHPSLRLLARAGHPAFPLAGMLFAAILWIWNPLDGRSLLLAAAVLLVLGGVKHLAAYAALPASSPEEAGDIKISTFLFAFAAAGFAVSYFMTSAL